MVKETYKKSRRKKDIAETSNNGNRKGEGGRRSHGWMEEFRSKP
jgi:hypothetical protein